MVQTKYHTLVSAIQTDNRTDGQTDRQTNRQTDKQKQTEADRQEQTDDRSWWQLRRQLGNMPVALLHLSSYGIGILQSNTDTFYSKGGRKCNYHSYTRTLKRLEVGNIRHLNCMATQGKLRQMHSVQKGDV